MTNIAKDTYKDKLITIFGLGLNGGGVASAAFFAGRGALVTVTDLRSKEELTDSINQLTQYDITYHLGEHLDADFTDADIVIKNPAIPSSSRFLTLAKRVETDISTFLNSCDNPILAITGSKGKSTTVTALDYILKGEYPYTKLGGNITVSPLSFLDDLLKENTMNKNIPVVLELSSWQLADLPDPSLLHPEVSVITNIMKDHQNRYNSMQEYIDDKKIIFQNQNGTDISLFPFNDFGKECAKESASTSIFFSDGKCEDSSVMGYRDGGQIYLRVDGDFIPLLKDSFTLPGLHIRLNILIAAIVAYLFGSTISNIIERIASFPGVEHRLEWVRQVGKIDFYNDTTATIPDALAAAVQSFEVPTVFVSGGNDKELDFSVLKGVLQQTKGLVLLKGDGTKKIIEILEQDGVKYSGPYGSFNEALAETVKIALELEKSSEAENVAVVLSPGCTSFGMFMNEFDRGNQFKDFVNKL